MAALTLATACHPMKLPAPTLSESAVSLWLAIYIGGLLNLDVFIRRLFGGEGAAALPGVALEAVSMVAISYLLLGILSLGGSMLWRAGATLMVLFSAAAAYYMTLFDVVIGYGVMASVLTTDIDLSRESVGADFLLWLLATTLPVVVLLWRVALTSTFWHAIRCRRRRWPVLGRLAFALLAAVIPLKVIEARAEGGRSLHADLPSAAGVVAHSYLPVNWVAGLGMVAYNRVAEQQASEQLFEPARRFTYLSEPALEDVTIVFVIGETARADHVGALGYGRETMPNMAREPNLVLFDGRACDTATKLSLRCMFVREGGAADDAGRTQREKNVFSTLKTLGFSAELFAMQSELWFYNSLNADNYLFREMIAAEKDNRGKPVDDMLLVPQLQRSLQAHSDGRHLVVLHTKGSHYQYSQRYPRAFARWSPECTDIDDSCSRESLINAYDNSLLYTDHFLKSVLDTLRGRKAVLFYAADHGESIDEGMHFHATPREVAPPEQFSVPMMVWMSDPYLAAAGGARLASLRELAKQPVPRRHEELFDSILGCAGFHSPDGGIVAANNWCRTGA